MGDKCCCYNEVPLYPTVGNPRVIHSIPLTPFITRGLIECRFHRFHYLDIKQFHWLQDKMFLHQITNYILCSKLLQLTCKYGLLFFVTIVLSSDFNLHMRLNLLVQYTVHKLNPEPSFLIFKSKKNKVILITTAYGL